MELPPALQDLFGFFNSIMPKSKEYKLRQGQLDELRGKFIFSIDRMMGEANDERTRNTLQRIKSRASSAIINTSDGYMLESSGGIVKLGENIKKMQINPATGEIRVQGPDVIDLPKGLLFKDGNKIREDGIMTLFHEWSHGGIGGGPVGEYLTDVVAIRAGIRLGLPEEAIVNHIIGRRAAYGIQGERKLLQFAGHKFKILDEREQAIFHRLKIENRKVKDMEGRTRAEERLARGQAASPQARAMRVDVSRFVRPLLPSRNVKLLARSPAHFHAQRRAQLRRPPAPKAQKNVIPFARKPMAQRRLRRVA